MVTKPVLLRLVYNWTYGLAEQSFIFSSFYCVLSEENQRFEHKRAIRILLRKGLKLEKNLTSFWWRIFGYVIFIMMSYIWIFEVLLIIINFKTIIWPNYATSDHWDTKKIRLAIFCLLLNFNLSKRGASTPLAPSLVASLFVQHCYTVAW